jgi:hypothetical protein
MKRMQQHSGSRLLAEPVLGFLGRETRRHKQHQRHVERTANGKLAGAVHGQPPVLRSGVRLAARMAPGRQRREARHREEPPGLGGEIPFPSRQPQFDLGRAAVQTCPCRAPSICFAHREDLRFRPRPRAPVAGGRACDPERIGSRPSSSEMLGRGFCSFLPGGSSG